MDYNTRKEQYKSALMKWKSDNGLSWFSRMPEKPKYRNGEDAIDYANKLAVWNKQKTLWQSAPKPEDYGFISPINEKFEMRIGLVLRFGAQHVKLFNFRLLSELVDFEKFLFKEGFKYEYLKNQDGSVEIDIASNYRFIFSEKSATFNLAIYSSDGVHITQFYFYNDKGYKDESLRVNTIADMHDFFMKDKRVITKKIKAEKGCHNFIQDYIAPYEAARIEDDRFYIVTSEEYKKLPKYRWLSIKTEWIIWFSILIFITLMVYSFFIGFSPKDKDGMTNTFIDQPTTDTSNVFICTGPQAKSYHKEKNCYGLQSCSSQIVLIELKEAQNLGRKPCRYCFE